VEGQLTCASSAPEFLPAFKLVIAEVGKSARVPKSKPAPRNRLILVAAALAMLLAGAAAAWYLESTTTVSSSEPVAAASHSVPTVVVMPLANVTGNPQFDLPAERIGQKTRDAAGNRAIWRIVGRPGGAAAGAADPIGVGRQLNADYVVTGNLESGGDALRVTFEVNDVHSGARLWSRRISPILESANTTAAEDEVAGRAAGLFGIAIMDAERARLSSAEKTTWGCVLDGFAAAVKPDIAANARACLEAAAKREPSNANVWEALANVIQQQRIWGWGLSPEEARIERRSQLADRELQAALRARDLAPLDSHAQLYVAMGYYAACQPERVQVEAEKAAALNPYDASTLGASRCTPRSPVTGMKGSNSPIRLSSWRVRRPSHTGGGRGQSEPGSRANIRTPMKTLSAPTSNRSGCRISISPTPFPSSAASMRPGSTSRHC
jgi:TolB-like protein